MNYYDELGVSRTASERELRQAYRVLVRLLHPDTQTGDDLRLAAERQLVRLNQMLTVLLNADTRRAYDLSLERECNPRISEVPHRPAAHQTGRHLDRSGAVQNSSLITHFAIKYWAMILIAAVIVGAAALSTLLRGSSESTPELHSAGTLRPDSKLTPAKLVVPGRSSRPQFEQKAQEQPAPVRIEGAGRFAALDPKRDSDEISPPIGGAITASPGILPRVDDVEPLKNAGETAAPRLTLVRPATTPSQVNSFAGNWLYNTELDSGKVSDGYQAIYVELLLSEIDGMLSGSYRARYLVPDQAISPQVSFHLEGRASSVREAHLGWSSADGTRGEAELTLGATGIMDFHWWRTKSSGQSSLSSGTAKLLRQRKP